MNTIVSSEQEMMTLIEDALPEIRELALEEFHRRVVKYDLKLSNELMNSFKAAVIKSANGMQQEIVLSFNLYGRYKDMKYVEYGDFKAPNNSGKKYALRRNDGPQAQGDNGNGDAPELVLAMKEFIEDKGLGTFKYLPGYTTNGSKRMPTTNRAVMRLAWSMAIDRLRRVRVKNRKKGWYNEARAVVVNKAGAELRKRIRTAALNAFSATKMGKEIVVKV